MKKKNVSNNRNRQGLICTDGLQASAQEADGWLVHPHLIYVVCVLSLKLLSLWLAAVVLLDGWCMFSAHRAGSDTGLVGAESIPISHLSETMRALLHTSPPKAVIQLIFHIWRRRKKKWREGWGHAVSLRDTAPMLWGNHALLLFRGKRIYKTKAVESLWKVLLGLAS